MVHAFADLAPTNSFAAANLNKISRTQSQVCVMTEGFSYFFRPHVSIQKITTKSVCGCRIFFFVSTTFFTTCPMRRISVKTNSMATMVPCNLVAILLKVKSGGEFQMHIACPHSTKTWRFSNVFISDVDFVDVTRARVTNADVVWAVQTFKLNQWICTKMGWYIKYKMCP